ncbi:helix-turn-helix domain-containing protein, partial [Psychrobacter sp. 1U2]
MSSTETAVNKNQGGIQSLEIGLSVLDVLIDYHKPMMLKDIAEAMQMHPAKVHRYLVSLIRKDYAR